MNLTPETIQQLAAHRIKPLGAPERTIQRAKRLVMVKIGKGKTVPVALREATSFAAKETDK